MLNLYLSYTEGRMPCRTLPIGSLLSKVSISANKSMCSLDKKPYTHANLFSSRARKPEKRSKSGFSWAAGGSNRNEPFRQPSVTDSSSIHNDFNLASFAASNCAVAARRIPWLRKPQHFAFVKASGVTVSSSCTSSSSTSLLIVSFSMMDAASMAVKSGYSSEKVAAFSSISLF